MRLPNLSLEKSSMSGFAYISFWLNLLIPGRCLLCDGQLSYQKPHQVCSKCWAQLPLIRYYCFDCGRPFSSFNNQSGPASHNCGNHKAEIKLYFRRARSIGLYQGDLKKLIRLFKYHKKSSLGSQLAGWMIQHMPKEFNPANFDYILPVPLHIKRLRKREFNQSLLLAKSIARYYQRPLMISNLYRRHYQQAQAQLKQRQRRLNIKGAFLVRQPDKLHRKSILLIDDVYTTGATVGECAKVLLRAGAERVEVLTLARTEEPV